MKSSGREMKAARERLGLSLAEASTRIRIPQRYLEALEKDDTSLFPPGPFLSGYTRQYRKFLGLSEARLAEPEAPERPSVSEPPSRRFPVVTPGALRLAALGALSFVALVMAIQVGGLLLQPVEPTLGEAPDQVVEVRPLERVKVRVTADDRILFEGDLYPKHAIAAGDPVPAGGKVCEGGCRFTAHDRLELSVSNLSLVGVTYGGRLMKPLGAQARPRRLVFIDDQG